MLCSKLHCQKVFGLKLFSYKIGHGNPTVGNTVGSYTLPVHERVPESRTRIRLESALCRICFGFRASGLRIGDMWIPASGGYG